MVAQAERGNSVVLSGEFSCVSIAYLATERDHGVVTEISSGKPGDADLKPDATYPCRAYRATRRASMPRPMRFGRSERRRAKTVPPRRQGR